MVTRLLMFPGQGSQYPGMAKDWYDNFQEAKLAFEEASDGSGLHLKKLCFEGSDSDLKQTEVTQPAILTASIAVFRGLQNMGPIKDTLFAGHSLGEYSALVAMGAIGLGEAARIVRHRGQYMQDAVPAGQGAMLALMFKPGADGSPKAQALCEAAAKKSGKAVSVANFNSPMQIVISGYAEAIQAAQEIAAAEASFDVRKTVPLPVSAPFHSELMAPAAKRLAPELIEAKWAPCPGKCYIANIDANVHVDCDGKEIAERLVKQITGSVRWIESAQRALEYGCTQAVEIGPGAVLAGLVKRIPLGESTLEAFNIDRLGDYQNGSFKL